VEFGGSKFRSKKCVGRQVDRHIASARRSLTNGAVRVTQVADFNSYLSLECLRCRILYRRGRRLPSPRPLQ
jgi:hypothetical protein